MRRPLRLPMLLTYAAMAGSMPAMAAAPARPAPPARPVPTAVPAPAPPPAPAYQLPPNLPLIADVIRRKAPGKFKGFYASRNFLPLWAQSGQIGEEADLFLNFLATASFDGLNPRAYKVDTLRRAIDDARRGDVRRIADADIKLSAAYARYVMDLRKQPQGGLTYADPSLALPARPREENVLRAAGLPQPFPAFVSAMGWMSPHYLRFRAMYGRAIQQGAPAEDLRRIRTNLERARVLPGPWTRHVLVDAASARLWYYQAGQMSGTMRVVVGKQASPTPMLAGMLQYAIVNPYWNVPSDLAQTLVAPKVLGGRSLHDMNMEALSDWTDSAHRLEPRSIDWNAVAAGTVELRVRQLPGPGNSMGRVKFLFPNELGIYLHDTPERDLLTKDDRHLSNGCIRLEDAPGLGRWLMGQPLRNVRDPEQVVPLPAPVPVFLTYFTATEGLAGTEFVPDVYGRDAPGLAAPATPARD